MNEQIQKSIKIKRHRSEMPLFVIMALFSLCVWSGIIFIKVGVFYAILMSLFFLFSHAATVAYVRGNGIQVTEEQFSDLYQLVTQISKQIGLKKTPEVYIMQSNGMLNAFATKFIKSKIIVIYTDLLEACGDNTDALRMILGHEMGHIKSGHLKWSAFLVPSKIIPFLGQAFSRAREYTCDKYGLSVVKEKSNAVLGLTILSVGKNYANQVSQQSMLKQYNNLNTGWMRIGEWLHSHPPLIKRISQLDLTLHATPPKSFLWASTKGVLIMVLMALVLITGTIKWFKFVDSHLPSKLNDLSSVESSIDSY